MEYQTNFNIFWGTFVLLVIGMSIIIFGNMVDYFSNILPGIIIYFSFLILYTAYNIFVYPIKVVITDNFLIIRYYYKKYNLELKLLKVREIEKHTRTGIVYYLLKINHPSFSRSFKIDSLAWNNYEQIKNNLGNE